MPVRFPSLVNAARGRPKRVLVPLALVLLLGGAVAFLGLWLWTGHQFDRHYQAAVRASLLREFGPAWEHLDACLAARPNNLEALLLAARTARRQGDHEKADRYLKTYRERQGSPELVELENVLRQVQRGDLKREAQLSRVVEAEHPEKLLILEALAQGYMRSFRQREAQRCLTYWLELDPGNALAWTWRGEVWDRLENRREAQEDFRRALELAPERGATRLLYADNLFKAKQYLEALEQYQLLRGKHAEAVAVELGLARCYQKLHRIDESRQTLDALAAREPDNVQVLAERGRLALDLEDYAGAEGWYRRATELAPHEREITYQYGVALRHLGKTVESDRAFARSKEIEKVFVELSELTKQIRGSPHDPEPRYRTGLIFLRSNQSVEGVRWLYSALQEDPRHRPSHQALAEHFEKQGDAERARYHRQAAGDAPGEPGR